MTLRDWYIVYTTSTGERLAKEDLESFGYEVFLPIEVVSLRPARHRKDRTKRVITRPLFPRYLFVGLRQGWHDFAGVRRSKRVQAFLTDAWGCPVRIDAKVVEALVEDMSRGRYDEAATRAKKIAEQQAAEAERLKALAEKAATEIRVGQEFILTAGLWKGFLATITAARKKEVSLEVKGESGATLSLDVPLLFLEQNGLLSGSTKGDGKNSAP